MFLIPFYQPRIPRLCTYAFQMLQSWWYIDFTSKVITLLDIAGLSVLVMACLLYCFEKMVFDYDCYGIVYDTGSMLCSCISSFLPSSCRPTYSYQPRQRHRSQQHRTSGLHFIDSVQKTVEEISLVFTTDGDSTDISKLIAKSPFYLFPVPLSLCLLQ